MRKIVCFHLYNDYSGSPKVLYNVLSGLLERGYRIELHTSKGGILDSLSHPNLKTTHYGYKFSPNVVVTMLRYLGIQLLTFCRSLRYAFSKDTVFYINTILPVGPALGGRMIGRKVVYHYHENAYIKSGFYRSLTAVMQKIAHRIICVSDYQASFLNREKNIEVIPNALDGEFISKLVLDIEDAFSRKTVLMLSSLKAYKGTGHFVKLASKLTDFNFLLVINDTSEAVAEWIAKEKITLSDNVSVKSRIVDVASVYNVASIVLNLSDPQLFVETFGLTALEAMSCALPVIVPPVGGIAEMVEDGVNGYKINCNDFEMLKMRITQMLTDKELYISLAENAYSTSLKFNRENTLNSLSSIFAND